MKNPPPKVYNTTALRRAVRLVSEAPANDPIRMAELQTRLGRSAGAVNQVKALGLVKFWHSRVGKRGGLRRTVLLTPKGAQYLTEVTAVASDD